ncbi:hypothetical protein BMS3Bbin10_00327 [bacterium BMS3Bbin10]|nr:hypothetical protein BMS3Bbin10_00327 [bacterium BMS3Bbin10]
MRVVVGEAAPREQRIGLNESLDDGIICVAELALVVDDNLAFKARRVSGEDAIGTDCVGYGGVDAALLKPRAVFRPDIEVIAAMTGSRVDKAGAGFLGDVIALEEGHVEVKAEVSQGVAAPNTRNEFAGYIVCPPESNLRLLRAFISQLICNQDMLARPRTKVVLSCLHQISAILNAPGK